MDLTLAEFADAVGTADPVTIEGAGTRGGGVDDVRLVTAPSGIMRVDAAEMVVECGAATPVAELHAALEAVGQTVAIPCGGTVGGALATGHSAITRLGHGAMRDVLLMAHVIDSEGAVVKAGGPTVKNVSGFDLCRLLVGSLGTLAFLGTVLLRTRPIAACERWFTSDRDPHDLLAAVYRPVCVLWNGTTSWIRLDGDAGDVADAADRHGLAPTEGPPALPPHRWSMKPTELASLDASAGAFVAEMGVGVIHRATPQPVASPTAPIADLHRRIADSFDPTDRLNPGRSAFSTRLMPAYVDRRVTDFAAAKSAAALAATRLGLVEATLIRHGMNAIYRCGDVVLRVATPNAPASVSIALASMLDRNGVPVAAPASSMIVESSGHAVTAWEYVEATGAPIDWRAVGEILRGLHAIPLDLVPAGVPTPSPTEFPWWDHDALLADVHDLLDDRARAGLMAAVERHRGWRDWTAPDEVLCHGDVHPGNVVMSSGGPVLVDWDLLCRAPRGWDHGPMMTWTRRWGGAPGVYEEMARGARWSGRGDRFADAVAELRLVSATLMRLKVSRQVPAAQAEARRRLEYWRGEPDATIWSAQ